MEAGDSGTQTSPASMMYAHVWATVFTFLDVHEMSRSSILSVCKAWHSVGPYLIPVEDKCPQNGGKYWTHESTRMFMQSSLRRHISNLSVSHLVMTPEWLKEASIQLSHLSSLHIQMMDILPSTTFLPSLTFLYLLIPSTSTVPSKEWIRVVSELPQLTHFHFVTGELKGANFSMFQPLSKLTILTIVGFRLDFCELDQKQCADICSLPYVTQLNCSNRMRKNLLEYIADAPQQSLPQWTTCGAWRTTNKAWEGVKRLTHLTAIHHDCWPVDHLYELTTNHWPQLVDLNIGLDFDPKDDYKHPPMQDYVNALRACTHLTKLNIYMPASLPAFTSDMLASIVRPMAPHLKDLTVHSYTSGINHFRFLLPHLHSLKRLDIWTMHANTASHEDLTVLLGMTKISYLRLQVDFHTDIKAWLTESLQCIQTLTKIQF